MERTHTQTEHHRTMNMNNTSWQSTKLDAIQLYRNFATILWWCGKAMSGRNVPISKPESQHMNASWLSQSLYFSAKSLKRTKSNSRASVQVKSAGSVVTVSLVPSQCSDTRVYTHKTNASGGWPNRLDAFKFSQLLASATTTTIATTIFAILISSSFCFDIFWRHVGNGLYTRSDDVVVRIYSHQFIDIATIDDPWAASLGIPSIVGQRFFGNEGEIGEMLHCYTQIHATFVFCSVKKAKNKQIMNTVQQER